VVLGQKYVDEKKNEIPAFQELLCYVNIAGKTITADAMHCQKDTCAMIIGRGGDYVFSLKRNHQTFYNSVESFFMNSDNTDKMETFEAPVEKQRGRIEQRIFYRVNDITQFGAIEDWTGIKSIFAIRCIVTTKYETTDEMSYYTSSLDSSPETLLKAVRSHWKIETTSLPPACRTGRYNCF
jgi:predicted transposase YbfD/YdcC